MSHPNFRRIRRVAAFAGAVGLTAAVLAGCVDRSGRVDDGGNYPSKPITLIVPYQAGGASDLSARTLAASMEETLGEDIVVENRTGGAGSVGLSYLATSAANGYTIGYLPVETVMLRFQGYEIDPAAYEPLGQIVSVPATIAVPAASPYQTLDDLLAAAKERPNAVTVSNSGAGSIWQATTTALNDIAGVALKPVPFDGGAPAVTAAVGSQVDAVVAGISETAPAMADGRLRVLALFADEPSDALPGVPTARELGHDLTIGGWGAIGAPVGLKENVRAALVDAVSKAAATPEFIKVIEKSGNVPVNVGPDQFAAYFADEQSRFEKLFAE